MADELSFKTGYRVPGAKVLADFERFAEHLQRWYQVVPTSITMSRTIIRRRPKKVTAEYGHATLSAILKYDGVSDVNVMTLTLRGGSPIWRAVTIPNSGRLEDVFPCFHFNRR